jgi:hypothetical protein
MLFYTGFAASIVGIASPWIGKSFNLDGAGTARRLHGSPHRPSVRSRSRE